MNEKPDGNFLIVQKAVSSEQGAVTSKMLQRRKRVLTHFFTFQKEECVL